MPIQMGFECQLNYNTTAFSSPTWHEIKIVREVKIVTSRDKSEATTRGDAVKTYGMGRPDISITCKLKDDPTHVDYEAIRDAFVGNLDLDLWASDGPILTTGSEGPRGDFKVAKFERSEDDEGVVFIDVEFCPSADSVNDFELWKESA